MSKKMKRVALESSPYVVFEDNKARLKHQTLLQDFQELHRETNDLRDKLEDAKTRKQRLLAEVHFLWRRHKCLLQMKSSSSHPEQQERAALPKTQFYYNNGMKDRFPSKKEAKQHKLPPLPGPKQKVRIQVAKEAPPDILVNHKQALRIGKDNVLRSTVRSLKHKSRVYSGKELLLRKPAPAFDLNQNNRSFAGNGSVSRSTTPVFDLNQENSDGGKDVVLPSQAPVIDLNEILFLQIGKEEPQANFEPLNFEEPKRGLIQNMNDDQHRDLKLSICRNVGEGTSRVEKRKILWEDPVALRV
ncbi:hypothetical protein K7X08_029554 [Anisodus acutangulus]|uniref:Uncharacterized protein n=1 Tax=Anisodus acutangulus TaxID=402998 RepID=A0A9Q1L5E5_9SOLA|nr:hypothetical protein K7X08_029554 [Anisodus acutangulus]